MPCVVSTEIAEPPKSAETVTIACTCGRTGEQKIRNGRKFLPRGWKRYENEVRCKACKKTSRKTRTFKWTIEDCVETKEIANNAFRVTYQVKSKKGKIYHDWAYIGMKGAPVDSQDLIAWAAEVTKKPVETILRVEPGVNPAVFLEPLFTKCRMMANRVMQIMHHKEKLPVEVEDKLADIPRTEVQQQIKSEFPGTSHLAESIVGNCMSAYMYRRYQIFTHGRSSLLEYKVGYPIPIRNKRWEPFLLNNEPHVRVIFTKEDDTKTRAQQMVFRLSCKRKFKSYRKLFSRINAALPMSEQVLPMSLQIQASCRADRPFASATLTALLTLDIPKDEADTSGRHGTFYLETGKNFLLSARVNERSIWTISGNQFPKFTHGLENQLRSLEARVKQHAWKLEQLYADNKFEDRVRGDASGIERTRQLLVKRNRDKMRSLMHELSARLVKYINRHHGGFETVVLDDTHKGWPKQFPWFEFFDMIGQKLDAKKIKFLDKHGQNRLLPKKQRKNKTETE